MSHNDYFPMKRIIFLLLFIFSLIFSCTESRKQLSHPVSASEDPVISSIEPFREDTIVDSDYTFEEAVAGTRAPQQIIDQLELIDITYLSTDGKIHKGQILTNQKLVDDIIHLFGFMLNEGFVVEKAIPIVKYNWSDSLSMDDNNTYSFCYRNISYSKHATGMAIDINPRFNPLRWKHADRPNQPKGAVLDTTVNGTLYSGHPVVEEFRKRGFRWGHIFSKYYDDHHFEKR